MIVPLVILLFGFIFYLTFYLYDRCVASQDAYLLAFHESIGMESKITAHKYIAAEGFDSTIQTEKRKIEVEITGAVTASFTEQLLPWRRWRFREKGQADKICPAECIRKVRLAKKITEEIGKTRSGRNTDSGTAK